MTAQFQKKLPLRLSSAERQQKDIMTKIQKHRADEPRPAPLFEGTIDDPGDEGAHPRAGLRTRRSITLYSRAVIECRREPIHPLSRFLDYAERR